MKTFRPAAASISLGCREFNLCVFVGAEILFFSVCFFSSFFYLLTCVVLPLSLSWSSLLVFASVCVWVFFFFLSSCFMMSSSQDASAKTNAKTAWIRSTRYFPKTAAGSGACVFFVLFSLWFRWTPPNSTRTIFFWTFLRVCWHPQIIFRFVGEMSGKCPGNLSFSPQKFTPPKVNPGGILGKS